MLTFRRINAIIGMNMRFCNCFLSTASDFKESSSLEVNSHQTLSLPVNFQHTSHFLYKLYCKDSNVKEYSIGYSSSTLSTTLIQLKSRVRSNSTIPKICDTIRRTGGLNQWQFMILEYLNTNNLQTVNLRKRYWKSVFDGNSTNEMKLMTSRELKRNYRLLKKDHFTTMNQLYRKKNSSVIQMYLRQRNTIIIHCSCGMTYKGLSNRSKHEKTRRHQLLLLTERSNRGKDPKTL